MDRQHLTICYLTNRVQPRFEWFFDTLAAQCDDYAGLSCIVIDFWAHERGRAEEVAAKAPPGLSIQHVTPKPTVWQGPHRLTTQDYFAAANARNTGLCLARDGWIAYCDDLATVLPGWLSCIREAMSAEYVVMGAYKKVSELTVEAGKVIHYRDLPTGQDSRWDSGSDTQAVVMAGGSFFGCSVAGPVEAFLSVNGWEEDCDSMGFEDSICGLMLDHQGWTKKYDRRMMTLESEDFHHVEKPPFKRIIKMKPGDASWAMLDSVMKYGHHQAKSYYPGGVRALRDYVQAGNPFPVLGVPTHDWRDGQDLRAM